MPDQQFPASMDGMIRGVTAVFWIAMGGAAVVVQLVPGMPDMLRWPLAAVLGLTPLLTLLLAPRGYRVTDAALQVERLVGPVSVPRAAITGARRITKADCGWLIRTFGSGGAHGIYGRFRSSELGPLDFKATRRDRWVLVTRGDGGRALVISPDDPDGLVAALAAHRS